MTTNFEHASWNMFFVHTNYGMQSLQSLSLVSCKKKKKMCINLYIMHLWWKEKIQGMTQSNLNIMNLNAMKLWSNKLQQAHILFLSLAK